MSGYLLDTNVVSELRKGKRGDRAVREWVANREDSDLWLSVLVIGELRRGVHLIERRDVNSAVALAGWLDGVVQDFGDRILPVTAAIAERWARVSVPDPVPVVDGLIAATGLVHDLAIVTRNVADIERTGVDWVDPFSGSTSG